MFRVNVLGTLGVLEACRAHRPEARVLVVSSAQVYGNAPRERAITETDDLRPVSFYGISKAAVNGISDALRVELSARGIHVMNVALASVGVEGPPGPGQVPVARFAAQLERAMHKRQDELYLSPITKWLMRLYRLYPPLARIRKVRPH